MAKMVAIGNRSFVLALTGIGAEARRCDDNEAFRDALRKVATRKGVRLVFAPEPLMMASAEAVAAFRDRSDAALLGLPLRPSAQHPSLEEVRYLIEQATGATLL